MTPSTIIEDGKVESLEKKWVIFYEGNIIIVYTGYFFMIKNIIYVMIREKSIIIYVTIKGPIDSLPLTDAMTAFSMALHIPAFTSIALLLLCYMTPSTITMNPFVSFSSYVLDFSSRLLHCYFFFFYMLVSICTSIGEIKGRGGLRGFEGIIVKIIILRVI